MSFQNSLVEYRIISQLNLLLHPQLTCYAQILKHTTLLANIECVYLVTSSFSQVATNINHVRSSTFSQNIRFIFVKYDKVLRQCCNKFNHNMIVIALYFTDINFMSAWGFFFLLPKYIYKAKPAPDWDLGRTLEMKRVSQVFKLNRILLKEKYTDPRYQPFRLRTLERPTNLEAIREEVS